MSNRMAHTALQQMRSWPPTSRPDRPVAIAEAAYQISSAVHSSFQGYQICIQQVLPCRLRLCHADVIKSGFPHRIDSTS